MKKILFATTALVASAGIASADISYSGSASAGVGSQAGAKAVAYNFADFGVAMSAEASNGLKFGANVSMTIGEKYDIGDFEVDGTQAGTFDFDGIFVEFGGSKLTIDQGAIDNLYDGDFTSHDLMFEQSTGSFSVAMTVDAAVSTPSADADEIAQNGAAANSAQFSFKVGYAANGIALTLKGDNNNGNLNADVNYTTGALKVGAAMDQQGNGNDETKVYGEYTTGGVKMTASAVTGKVGGLDWDLGATYTMNSMSVSASFDEASAWDLAGTYDFGGGLSAVAGAKSDNSFYAGLTMKF